MHGVKLENYPPQIHSKLQSAEKCTSLDDFDFCVKVTDEAVLGQLAQLCQRYGIDAEKISCEYFSFANNTKATIMGKLLRGGPFCILTTSVPDISPCNLGPPTLEALAPFENEKLKTLKPAGQRRPLDPIEVLICQFYHYTSSTDTGSK